MGIKQFSKFGFFMISIIIMMMPLLYSQKTRTLKEAYGENITLNEGHTLLPLISFSNGISYIDRDMLIRVLGGETYMNFGNFTILIEKYFIPTNMRVICLSIGWEEHANTTHSDIIFYKWIDDFLAATDQYGINVFFIFDFWKKVNGEYSWWIDFSTDKLELQKLLENSPSDTNEPILLIADLPYILEQFKEDLKQLYNYYGKHVSWKGMAFKGSDDITSFIPVNDLPRKIISNNYTLNNFLNSVFYLREMITDDTHLDGTKCRLWQQFRENEALLTFSSGYWQKSYPQNLSENQKIAMIFKANISANGFKLSWYGRRLGAPSELKLELYDVDISYNKVNTPPIEIVRIPTELIRMQTCWQPFVEFKSSLNKGATYSIVFSVEDSESFGKYEIYYKSWRVDDSMFLVSDGSSQQLNWQFQGSAIIWIKDMHNIDHIIYPFQDIGIFRNDRGNVKQIFQAPENITFNTIFLNVADRPYDENVATVKILRNSDNKVIARGTIDPSYTKGMYWWLPVPLESETFLEGKENYTLIVERMSAGEGWELHYLMTDPAVAGPQGNDKMLLFKLAYIDPILINFMRIGPPGRAGPEAGWPGAEYRTWWAQRYSISRTAPLVRVEVNIQKYGNPGNLTVRLREDDGTGLAPAKYDVEVMRIPATDIPDGRVWLSITGWNATLNAGKMYWIILSTDETQRGNGYWPWKIEYAYKFLIKRSDDAGASWVRPHEPAELYINLFTSEETFVVEPEYISRETFATDIKQVAQSFSLQNDTYVHGILIFLSRSHTDQNGLLIAEIRPDNGFDSPSEMVLTSGEIRMVENGVTFMGMQLVTFKHPYFLKAGVKYWLVIRGDKTSRIEPLAFAFHYPELSYGGTHFKTKITRDEGQNWYLPENREADLLFGLVKAPCNLRFFTAQELIADIKTYHIHDVYDEPIHGLNAYLNVQISNLQKRLVQWFKSYTGGRSWFSLYFNHPSILEEIQGWRELFSVIKVNNISKVCEIVTEFPKAMIIPELNIAQGKLSSIEVHYGTIFSKYPWPFMLFNLDDILLLEKMMKTNIASLWNTMKLMRYVGEPYGRSEDTVRVLLIGNEDTQVLAHYLLSIVNVTLARVDIDNNLSRFSNLKTYEVVILALDKYSAEQLTRDAQQRLKDFVEKGGGLVVMFDWPEWVNEVVGFNAMSEKISSGQISYVNYKHPILTSCTSIDWYNVYWNAYKIIQMSENATFIVRDSNGQPWISSNPYGLGLGILCGASSDNINELKYDYLTILTNAIFYAAKKGNILPAVWYGDHSKEKSLSDGTAYTISGKPGGPILLWFTGNNNEKLFEINLNANFFKIDTNGWVVLDATSWLPITMGNGTEIYIKIHTNPLTWLPIYIFNYTKDFNVLYSNLLVEAQKIYPNQALYEICPTLGQDVWLIVQSTVIPKEIKADTNPIRSVGEFSNLYKPSVDLYFYDKENRLTYIRFKAKEKNIIVRMIYEETRPPFYMLEENKQFIYALLILSFVLVELYAFSRARSKVSGEQSKNRKTIDVHSNHYKKSFNSTKRNK